MVLAGPFDFIGDLPEYPSDSLHAIGGAGGGRTWERVLQVFRRLCFLPGAEVKPVKQHLGKVTLFGHPAAKGEVEPVEVLTAVLGGDAVGRGAGAMVAGPVNDSQVLRLAQNTIHLATFQIGAFDAEGGIAVVVVGSVQHAASGGDQGQQAVPFDRQFVFPPVVGPQVGLGPSSREIFDRLREGLPTGKTIAHGGR